MIPRLSPEHKNIADTLTQIGQQVRVKCCGGNKSAIISHTERGHSFHCFRCGSSEFTKHGVRSIQNIAASKAFAATRKGGVVLLPDDFCTNIPVRFTTWFTKYGISPEYAAEHGFGWSDDMQRIVIPVYWNGTLLTYQARAVHTGQLPKYLTPSFASAGRGMFLCGNKQTNNVVLTEDILSAMKIGRAGKYAASLMGCEITHERAAWIIKARKSVSIWLDPDNAGQTGARKIARKLELYGIECRNILSEYDPKGHTLDEIREYVGGTI